MELEGHVEEPQFLRHLVEMGRDRFTGAVRLEREELIKILYLQDGNIISASTNDPTESVDEILLRAKKVGREHIQQALVKRRMDETLGDALLNAGFITRKELRWARRHQIVSVLRSALASPDWHYTVVPDYVSSRSSEGTHFPVEPLLVELVVTDPDRDRVDQRLSGGEVRLRKAPNFEERYPHLGLNEDADRVAALVDGKRSAAEIASEAGGNGFMNLKLLASLHLLGVVEINPEAQEQLEISFGHGAAPEASLLPGIEAQPPMDIPRWEVESLPEPESPETSVDSVDLELDSSAEQSVVDQTPWYEEESVPAPSREVDQPSGDLDEEPGLPGDAPAPTMDEFDVPAGWSDTAAGLFEEEEEAAGAQETTPAPQDDSGVETTELFEDAAPGEPLTPKRPSRRRWFLGAAILLAGVVALSLLFWPFADREALNQETGPSEREPVALEAIPGTTTIAPTDDAPAAPPESITEDAAPAPEGTDGTAEIAPAPARDEANVTQAADTPLRERYDLMANEYLSMASDVPYTVQFEIVCQTASVTLALNEGGTSVWFIPIQYQGRPCYRVFWGRYENEAAAAAATSEIPSSLRGGRPVVVRPERIVQ